MAEPGDPPPSDDHDHAHDDLVGFTSAASLAANSRPRLASKPVASFPEESEQAGLFDPPMNRIATMRTQRAEGAPPATPAAPATWAEGDGVSIPAPAPVLDEDPLPKPIGAPSWAQAQRRAGGFGRAPAVKPPRFDDVEGAMGLFAVYALILFAVPTMGVAAAVALVAVMVRPRPEQTVARSHFDFQKRTLWIGAVVAMVGVVLILVNLGVFVLFFVAVWLLLRGAWGLLLLARGEAIARPRQWLIAAR